jgi:SAM-dependent methyltransferase
MGGGATRGFDTAVDAAHMSDRRFGRTLSSFSQLLGIDAEKGLGNFVALRWYLSDLRKLRKQQAQSESRFNFGKLYPCLADRRADGGTATGHYFHQDLLVARRIHQNRPVRHVDVGSRVDGFIAHVASFRPIVVMDIRNIPSIVPNMEFIQADLMRFPEASLVGSFDSLSSLHALEHFGLGRYGDPINYEGHLVGLTNMSALLAPGGKFYFSVPVGPQRIEFNAHRVFSIRYLLDRLDAGFRIDDFSYVDDKGDLHEHAQLNPRDVEDNFGCTYGCGIFEATKK